jgi:hypothetical protein
MRDLAHWLEELGMSEYAQRFAENDIDASVLAHLTDQSLKELGVSLSAAMSRSTWAMACSSISVTRRPTRMMLRGR